VQAPAYQAVDATTVKGQHEALPSTLQHYQPSRSDVSQPGKHEHIISVA
jgi:hypothetical protein